MRLGCYHADMKLLLATMVYLLMAAFFCWGILLMMHGKPALLIGVSAVFVVLFAKIGRASH